MIENLSKEEKKKLDIAKAKSDSNTWKEFFLSLVDEKYHDDEGRK